MKRGKRERSKGQRKRDPEFWAHLRMGIREAAAGPVFMLGGSVMGFGAVVEAQDLHWIVALFSNLSIFALPGQLIFIETFEKGLGWQWEHWPALLAIWIAVSVSAVRLMPMAMVFITAVRQEGQKLWPLLILGFVVAITAWIFVLRKRDVLAQKHLFPYAIGFGFTIYIGSTPFAAFGYWAAELLPTYLSISLVLIMPLYFATLFSADWRNHGRMIAIACGVILGPPFYLWDQTWGPILAGLLAGTLAFFMRSIALKGKGSKTA